jgi:tripartite-type tricarboxylate transporter receptor subunit TctC
MRFGASTLSTRNGFVHSFGDCAGNSKGETVLMAIKKSILVALALCAAMAPASAQESEKAFFTGKTVRIVVGSGTGGGYDIYTRLIAPYLAKELGATVIVENQPGAGGIISLNRLYNAATDGLTLSFANGTSAAFSQLTDQQGMRYDLAKFSYLATVGAPPGLWLVGPDSPIKSVEDALKAKKKWRWAASGPSDGLGNGAAFTCEALNLDCHIVPGYAGSNQAALAVTKDEMDAVYVPESSANNFVKAKQNWALATMNRKKSRWFQDRPTIFEATKMTPEGEWAIDFYAGVEDLGRVLIAPPNMPAPRLAFLEEVVKRTLHNPQLIADGERSERIIEYLDPASTHKNVLKVTSNVTPEQKKRVLEILAKAR